MQMTERTPAMATLSDACNRASSRVSYTTTASPAASASRTAVELAKSETDV